MAEIIRHLDSASFEELQVNENLPAAQRCAESVARIQWHIANANLVRLKLGEQLAWLKAEDRWKQVDPDAKRWSSFLARQGFRNAEVISPRADWLTEAAAEKLINEFKDHLLKQHQRQVA